MKNAMRWVLITMMTVAVMASGPGGASVAMAAEVEAASECPQQVGNGVICTGPTIPTDIPADTELGDTEPGDTEPGNSELDDSELEFQLGEPLKVVRGDGDDDAECPIPVGNGVICTGPTLPAGTPVDGQSATFDNWVFLPVIHS